LLALRTGDVIFGCSAFIHVCLTCFEFKTSRLYYIMKNSFCLGILNIIYHIMQCLNVVFIKRINFLVYSLLFSR